LRPDLVLLRLELGGDLALARLEGVAHLRVLRHLHDDDVGAEVAQAGGLRLGGVAEGQERDGEEAEAAEGSAGMHLQGHEGWGCGGRVTWEGAYGGAAQRPTPATSGSIPSSTSTRSVTLWASRA